MDCDSKPKPPPERATKQSTSHQRQTFAHCSPPVRPPPNKPEGRAILLALCAVVMHHCRTMHASLCNDPRSWHIDRLIVATEWFGGWLALFHQPRRLREANTTAQRHHSSPSRKCSRVQLLVGSHLLKVVDASLGRLHSQQSIDRSQSRLCDESRGQRRHSHSSQQQANGLESRLLATCRGWLRHGTARMPPVQRLGNKTWTGGTWSFDLGRARQRIRPSL